MSVPKVNIIEDFEAHVAAVDAALYSDVPGKEFPHVYFYKGHTTEIQNIIAEKLKSPDHKDAVFPMIALLMDFPESKDPRPQIYADATVVVLIVAQSNATDRVDQRMSKVFNPVLIPIYERFIEQLDRSGLYKQSSFPHRKTLRPFWGKEGSYGNIAALFNGACDSIEIVNLKLSRKYNQCKPQNI